jgi:hypothetical protein
VKLARIEHYRCDQPIGWKNGTGYTYVWVPESWTNETLADYVNMARDSYLLAEHEFKKATPPMAPAWSGVDVSKYPDTMSVAEIKADIRKREEAYKAHRDKADLARKPFAWHLKQVTGGAALEFWENKPTVTAKCDWGHNHSITLEHSPTQIGDFPFEMEDDDIEDL